MRKDVLVVSHVVGRTHETAAVHRKYLNVFQVWGLQQFPKPIHGSFLLTLTGLALIGSPAGQTYCLPSKNAAYKSVKFVKPFSSKSKVTTVTEKVCAPQMNGEFSFELGRRSSWKWKRCSHQSHRQTTLPNQTRSTVEKWSWNSPGLLRHIVTIMVGFVRIRYNCFHSYERVLSI